MSTAGAARNRYFDSAQKQVSFTKMNAVFAAQESKGTRRNLIPGPKPAGRAAARTAIEQGAVLQCIAYEAAVKVRDAVSDEELERARARCQAIAAVTRAWTDCRSQVRIEQGKPLPGPRRPV